MRIVALTVIVGGLAVARGSLADSSQSSANAARAIEGSWMVRDPANPGPLLALSTFSGDTVVVSPIGEQVTAAHGAWVRTGPGEFLATFWHIRRNATNQFAGTVRHRQVITLGADGNSFTATGTTDVFDASGALLASTTESRIATRIVVEPLN